MSRRETLSGKLIRAISERIATGVYPVGDKLPSEQELIEEFGVSRTVVREAIANLKAGGLVRTVQGLGAFVEQAGKSGAFQIEEASNLSAAQEVMQVLELRLAIEAEAAALAARRRNEVQLATLQATVARLRELQTAAVFDEATATAAADCDIAFHRALADATGNMHFVRLFNYLGEYMVSRSRMGSFKFGGSSVEAYLARTIAEHERICQAIASGDADTARAAIRLHLAGSRERLQQQIDGFAAS